MNALKRAGIRRVTDSHQSCESGWEETPVQAGVDSPSNTIDRHIRPAYDKDGEQNMDAIEAPNRLPVKGSFFARLRRPRILGLLAILVSLATLTVTLFLVQRSQTLRSRAQQPEGLPLPPQGFHWQLVWNDEFEGSQINGSNWEIIGDEPRRDGWWLKEDAYLDGQGHLVLRTKKNGDRYSSGAVRTRGRFEHTFGYYEARVQFPSQEGHWPAFWLFSNSVNNVDGSGRDGTEIDIIEKPWTTDLVHQALHWDGYGEAHQAANRTEISIPGISQGWHTIGLDWRADSYTFYIDGQATWSSSAGGVSQVPEYIKLTEEIGEWVGNIENANLPDYFTVDYVRVYDLVQNGEETPAPTETPFATATASSTETATPSVSPSFSPNPTGTPPPSPTGNVSQQLTLKMKFAGVTDGSAEGAKVTLRFQNSPSWFDYITRPIMVTHIGNGVYQATLTFGYAVPPLPARSYYAIYLKGEKHLATKFCQQTGQTTRCTGNGSISIPAATFNPASYVLEFTGLPLEPGDLYPQDGIANSADFTKIKDLLSKPCSGLTVVEKMTADLDYNGCINVMDAFLLRKTLETRYDEN